MCSENELKEAVKVVQMGMSLCYVSEFFYGILKSTLVDKVSGHTSLNKKKGPEPMLSRDLEDRITKWLTTMAWIGYGQMKNNVLNKVQELVKKMNIITLFPDNPLSDNWYRLFMKKHPTFTCRCQDVFQRNAVKFHLTTCLLGSQS